MDKLTMAHEYAVKLLSTTHANHGYLGEMEIENIKDTAYALADAMQAEADKRKPSGVPEAIRSLTKDNDGNCLHFHHEFGHKNCMDCGASLEQWQPDWSQAPEWANWWSITRFSQGHWFSSKPEVKEESWVRSSRACRTAPSFNYQGNWKDSLRKRPEIKESCQ